ncbi:catalase family protein [soil metagenome]
MIKRVLLGVLVALVIIGIGMVVVEGKRRVTYMGEQVPPDEATFLPEIIASAIDSINYTPEKGQPPTAPPYRRDVHSKAHGCVRALVDIASSIDARFQQGVFAQAGTQYRAWIRFSNGNTVPQEDSKGDARGMAIKLMGVDGPKLLEPEQTADTQDFVLINSTVFFIRNVAEYAKFTRLLADGSRLGYFFNENSPNPFTWNIRDMILALKTLKKAPDSLLHEQFFSLSAYRLGDLNIKLSAAACTPKPVVNPDRKDANFLRSQMKSELAQTDGCFNLMVQPQVAGKNMPVEDPTVNWKESDSPFVKVATITVPKQEFDTPQQNDFCEALSFNPWHSLEAHRPIGGLNRIRKAVYLEDSRYRRDKMNYTRAEPKGWCLDLTGTACAAH